MRENGSSLDFNFISLLNSTVNKNWVCQQRLLQFFLGKWCRVRCSELCKLFVNINFLCAWIDLFIIFICSLYSPWATIRLLHHQFWLFMYINFRLCCTHFSCHRRKICNVSGQLVQISRRQRDPWMSKKEKEIITLTVRILFSDLKKWKYPFFSL